MRRNAIGRSGATLTLALLSQTTPAAGQETRFPWEKGVAQASAEAAAPSAQPAPAKPAAKPTARRVTPKPAANSPAPTTPAPAVSEERVERLEAALRDAGLLRDDRAGRAAEIRAEIERLELQQQGLETALANGVAIDGIEGTLADLKQRIATLRAELAPLEQALAAEPVPGRPDPRVDALEARLAALEAGTTPKSEAPPAPAAKPEPAEPASAKSEPAEEEALESGYDDGFVLRSADGVYTLVPNGFLQVLLSYRTAGEDPPEVAFSLPRARAGMKGTVFSKDFKYNFFADFGKGVTQLNYFYGDYTFSKDYAAVRVGLFKRPFSRAVLTSSEKQHTVSSPLTLKAFDDAHDVGIMLHNGTPTLEYAVGVFNGTGSKSDITGDVVMDPTTGSGSLSAEMSNVPDRFHPMVVTRLAYNHGGIKGYSQGDLEGGPLRFSLGTGGVVDFDADDDDESFVRGTLDAVVKAHGFSAVAAGLVSSRQAGTDFGARAYDAAGVVLQAGQVLAERFEPALRYTWLDQDGAVSAVNEVAAAFTWYFEGHDLKWQTEWSHVSGGGDPDESDWAAMTQFHFGF